MVSSVTCLVWLTPCRTLRNEPTRYFLTIPATFAVSSLPSVSISEILIWTICPILSSSVILPRTLSTLASSSASLLMTGSTFPEQEEAMAPIIAADAARFEIFMVSVLFCVIFMMFSLGFSSCGGERMAECAASPPEETAASRFPVSSGDISPRRRPSPQPPQSRDGHKDGEATASPYRR